MIDSHCHLDFDTLKNNISIIINNAKTNGIIIGFVKLRVKATATNANRNNDIVIILLFSKLL